MSLAISAHRPVTSAERSLMDRAQGRIQVDRERIESSLNQLGNPVQVQKVLADAIDAYFGRAEAVIERELVIGGVGLGILPNIMCQNDVRAKRLVRVLTDWESPSLQVSATFLGKRKESRRLRAFLDFMERKLKIEGSAGQPLSAIHGAIEIPAT